MSDVVMTDAVGNVRRVHCGEFDVLYVYNSKLKMKTLVFRGDRWGQVR